MIQLKRASVTNFGNFEGELIVSYDNGVTVITGLNGEGKSLLFVELITLALFKSSKKLKGETSAIINNKARMANNSAKALIKLVFNVDGNDYRVTRHFGSGGKDELERIISEKKSKSLANGTSAVTEAVVKLIGGINYEEMLSSCVVAQKKIDWFRNQEKSLRDTLYNSFLNLHVFTELDNKFYARLNDLTGRSRKEIKRIIEGDAKEKSIIGKKKEELRKLEEIDEASCNIRRLTDRDREAKKRLFTLSEISSKLKQKKETKIVFEQLKRLLYDIERKKEEIENLEREIQELEPDSEVVESIQKVKEYSTSMVKSETELSRLDDMIARLDNQINEIKTGLNKREKEKGMIIPKIKEYGELKEKLTRIKEDMDKKLEDLNGREVELQEKITAYLDSYDKISKEIESHKEQETDNVEQLQSLKEKLASQEKSLIYKLVKLEKRTSKFPFKTMLSFAVFVVSTITRKNARNRIDQVEQIKDKLGKLKEDSSKLKRMIEEKSEELDKIKNERKEIIDEQKEIAGSKRNEEIKKEKTAGEIQETDQQLSKLNTALKVVDSKIESLDEQKTTLTVEMTGLKKEKNQLDVSIKRLINKMSLQLKSVLETEFHIALDMLYRRSESVALLSAPLEDSREHVLQLSKEITLAFDENEKKLYDLKLKLTDRKDTLAEITSVKSEQEIEEEIKLSQKTLSEIENSIDLLKSSDSFFKDVTSIQHTEEQKTILETERRRIAKEIGNNESIIEKNRGYLKKGTRFDEKVLDLDFIREQIGICRNKLEELRNEVNMILKSQKIMDDTIKEFKDRVSPRAGKFMGHMLFYCTEGKYTAVKIDEDLKLTVRDQQGEFRKIDLFSGGETDLFLLSFRLAIIFSLMSVEKGTKPDFLILDECLAHLDSPTRERTFKHLVEVLPKYFKQIFIITHQEDIVSLSDSVIRIENGKIHRKKEGDDQ
ncbi:MAG: AAA family ATPase [Candidatus Odinarchaeota archaeon]